MKFEESEKTSNEQTKLEGEKKKKKERQGIANAWCSPLMIPSNVSLPLSLSGRYRERRRSENEGKGGISGKFPQTPIKKWRRVRTESVESGIP